MIKTEHANANTRGTHLCLQFNLLVSTPPFFPTTLHLDKYDICMKFGNNMSDTTKYYLMFGWMDPKFLLRLTVLSLTLKSLN